MADLRFASYAQAAIAGALDAADDGTGGPLGRPKFVPRLTLSGPHDGGDVIDGTPSFELPGPGAVAGLDAGCITRMEPPPGTGDAEPNYLAGVELRPVELPWLFTPAQPSAPPRPPGRLRPWIVLLVVDADAVALQPGAPLPRIDVPVAELPDLRESWAWAHVQVPSADAAPPPGIPAVDGQAVARLLCPRRLRPRTRYRACVVPAFRGGREAGLSGDDVDPDTQLQPAWVVGGDERVTLPVYHHWEFGTGEDGDFEKLVRRLGPAPDEVLAGLGTRLVDVAEPWPGVRLADTSADAPATVPVPGALRVIGDPPDGTATHDAVDDLATRLAAEARSDGVTPPLYGGRHVLRDAVTTPPTDWLGELNLTAATRIGAGLGAAYVRANQEQLMARAWERAGAIRAENRRRALGELAESVATSLHVRHVASLTPGEAVLLAAPAAALTPVAPSLTLGGEVTVSTVPDAAASPAFARIVLRRSVLRRTFAMRPSQVIERAAEGVIATPATQPLLRRPEDLTPEPAPPDLAFADAPGAEELATLAIRTVTTGRARGAARDAVRLATLARAARTNGLTEQADQLEGHVAALGIAPQVLLTGALHTLSATFEPQLAAVTQTLQAARADAVAGVPKPGTVAMTKAGLQLDVSGLGDRVIAALDPAAAIRARLAAGAAIPTLMAGPEAEPFDRVMLHPTFPAPMALALVDFAPAWVIPGIAGLPADSCALLRPDAPFIESFLVGLAHELANELRWREFPTDLRGTPFRRFWPRPEGGEEIPPIHTWTGALGSHLADEAEELAVLLVRGSVVRRFPDMIVAAAPALDGRTAVLDPAQWQAPVFVIRVDEQTAAYAFRHPDPASLRLPPTQTPGLFFVFQEHSYRIRFGFDSGLTDEERAAGATGEPPATWDDVDWDDVPQARGFAVADAELRPADGTTDPAWQRDSADVARITLQHPVRVLVHSHALVGR